MITSAITGINPIKDILPLGWESQGLLTGSLVLQPASMCRVAEGEYQSHFNGIWSDYYLNGRYYYNKYCLSVFRSACNSISFDYKMFADGYYVNVAGGEYTKHTLALSVVAYPVTPEGIVDNSNPSMMALVHSASYYVDTDLDWTAKTFSAFPPLDGKVRQWLFYISVNFQVITNQEDYDLTGIGDTSYASIRNIKTAPLSFMFINPPIGAINTALTGAELNISSSPMAYFQGIIKQMNLLNILMTGGAINNGVFRNVLNNAGEYLLEYFNPAYSWSIPNNQMLGSKIIYTLTLTGDNESPALDDIEIPISSFQSVVKQGGSTQSERESVQDDYDEQVALITERWNEGNYYLTLAEMTAAMTQAYEDYQARLEALNTSRASYLSAVIPSSYKYADDINNRTNGVMIIKKGHLMKNGTRNLEEIVRANFDYLSIDRGSNSDSGTIVGYKTRSYLSPKTRSISGVSYYAIDSSGRKRIRATMDLFLKPNDICIYGAGVDDYFTVGQIIYTVNVKNATMEVTEIDEVF